MVTIYNRQDDNCNRQMGSSLQVMEQKNLGKEFSIKRVQVLL